MQPLLMISDLRVSVENKPILKGISLTVNEGETHAIMGPNGSGKSTLVNALMGHPSYEITGGSVQFRGKNLLSMPPEARAATGLFLAFQYPKEIAGVSLRSFLFAAYNAIQKNKKQEIRNKKLSPIQFKKLLEEHMRELHMDPSFAERFVNQGFSGGEKKKAEILQLKVLQPNLALLDETDSGLDIDALKIVAEGINSLRSLNPFASFLLVTHYARILTFIQPDLVHVMVGGKIVESGRSDLAGRLEMEGYKQYGELKKIPLQS